MYPTFGHVLGEPIPAYFTMMMVAFAASTWVAIRWAKRERRDHDVLIDLALISLITGVAGARIAHVLFDGYFMDYVHLCTDYTLVDWHIPRSQCLSDAVQGSWDPEHGVCHPTSGDCFAWAKFWQGGLTWYGGLAFAVGYAMYFLRHERFPRIKALDLAGMIVPLGLFFGRLGCWFGGCCFGQPTDAWYGVQFPEGSPASEQQWRSGLLDSPFSLSLPVVPTQLMESLGCLAIAAISIVLVQPHKRFDGQTFCVSMALYAILRFVLESFRADDRGGAWSLSTSQWIGVLILLACVLAWRPLARHAERRRRATMEKLASAGADEPAPRQEPVVAS